MRLLLTILLFLGTLQAAGATRLRLLLRDATDAGVAGVTLNVQRADGTTFTLTTDARGVAESGELSGVAVWLMSGQQADGRVLQADSYPAGTGFRLVLIPGQTREALLRLDGASLVLDPAMIFTPDKPAAPAPATIDQLVPTPISAGAIPAQEGSSSTEQPPEVVRSGLSIVWWVLGVGTVFIVLALAVGILRRRTA